MPGHNFAKHPLKILRPCDDMWGYVKLLDSDPVVTEVLGSCYMPFRPGDVWGVFHEIGSVVEETIDYQGPNSNIIGQDLGYHPGSIELHDSEDATYVYGGVAHSHFGHFLINTLPRLWMLYDCKGSSYKILMHSLDPPGTWFSNSFVREALSAIGLSEHDIVILDRPTRIPRLIVPSTAFREQQFVHSAFPRLCRAIGRRLLEDRRLRPSSNPVYFTKRLMTSGHWKFVDEPDIANYLADAGVEIVSPEKITLAEKVAIFSERACVAGLASSGMHAALFCPPVARGVILNINRGVNSNFLLADLSNNNEVDYVYSPGRVITETTRPGFNFEAFIGHPRLVARDLLAMM